MKKNEEMYNTNRMAIKLADDSKLYIDRMEIDDIERYIVTLSSNAYINGVNLNDNSIIMFSKMLIAEEGITLKTIIQENIAIRERYFVNDGFLDTHYRSYIPMPEEYTGSREMFLELSNIEEICTDLDMFKDMMDNKLIIGKPEDLADYGLYYPQIRLLKNKTLAKSK